MEIFLSYSWKNFNEANRIDEFFNSLGIHVIRDITHLNYKDNIKEFMSNINNTDYSIIILSFDYFCSKNCLFELFEIFQDKDFSKKIIPIYIDSVNIFSLDFKISILKFWENIIIDSKNKIEKIDPTKSISIYEEINNYENIYLNIDQLINKILSIKLVSYSECISNNFKYIIDYIDLPNPDLKLEIMRINKLDNEELHDIEFEKLKNKYGRHKDIIYSQGYNYLTLYKKYIKSKELFLEYINVEYDYAALNNLGLSFQNLNDFTNAEFYFKESLNSKYAFEPLYNLGNIESKKGNFKMALDYWIECEKNFKVNSVCLFNIGKLYCDYFKDNEKGKEYYLKSINENPLQEGAYTNLAGIYFNENKIEEAIDYNKKGYMIHGDARSINNLASYYNILNINVDKIPTLFKEAIKIDQNYISPKLNLAKFYLRNNINFEYAISLFEEAYKLNSNDKDVKMVLKSFF